MRNPFRYFNSSPEVIRFVKINGETHYLWRAVDHEGEVLEVFATKRRDRKAALKFLKRTMKRYGQTNWLHTLPMAAPLSLRKSAIAFSDSPRCQRSHISVFSAAVKPRRTIRAIETHPISPFKIKCCVDLLRPPPINGPKSQKSGHRIGLPDYPR